MKEEIKRSWYPDGQLKSETPYKNGKAYGLEKWWWFHGEFWREATYKNDMEHGARIFLYY